MQRRDIITLNKIKEEADIAIELLGDMSLDEFLADELVKRAVGMTIINIGELVKNLTAEFRLEHNNVPWKDIAGFRDIAAHKYKTLDMRYVYNTIKVDVPDLKKAITEKLQDSI